MDPATLTAIFGGITSILGGAALLIRQVRASDEEDVKKLRARVERAEKRNEELEQELNDERDEARARESALRDEVNTTSLKVWRLEQILRQNGIDPTADVVIP